MLAPVLPKGANHTLFWLLTSGIMLNAAFASYWKIDKQDATGKAKAHD
uniref:Uncharacterized protein n=1 Tax=Tetraselmis sp. GSL018 TaxID=582737 RepID=A0A061QWP5_9CHLO